jgi:hypothetical protein
MAAQDPPVSAGAIGGMDMRGDRLLFELLLREFTAHAAVVGDLDRLLAALHPFRNHGLDMGPGADRFHEHALRLMEFGFCHD